MNEGQRNMEPAHCVRLQGRICCRQLKPHSGCSTEGPWQGARQRVLAYSPWIIDGHDSIKIFPKDLSVCLLCDLQAMQTHGWQKSKGLRPCHLPKRLRPEEPRCSEGRGVPCTHAQLACMRRSHSCRCCFCFLLFSCASPLLCVRNE